MGQWKMSMKWIVYCISLNLLVVFYLGTEIFDGVDGFLLGAGLVLLVLAVYVGAYLARPSVREALGLIFTLYHAHRAMNRGDYARAEAYLGKAVAQAEVCNTNRDRNLGIVLGELGHVYRTQGRLADAVPVLERALRHLEEAEWSQSADGAKGRCNRATGLCNLAAVYINQGRFWEAEPLCREALAVFDQDAAAGPQHMAVALHNLALVQAGRGDYAEAERLSREALVRIPQQARRGNLNTCVILSSLADLSCRNGRPDEAEPLARRAVTQFEQGLCGPEHPLLSRFLNVLAETLREQGNLNEAEAFCRRSQHLTEKAFGPDHPRLDGCLATLARIRIAQNRPADAEPLLQRCLSILDASVVADHPDLRTRREEYAAVLRQLGRPTETLSTSIQATGPAPERQSAQLVWSGKVAQPSEAAHVADSDSSWPRPSAPL
jgi:tetratricopeptide (TPR) repeat protein